MAIQHRDIENNERHEIKGADTALAGTVPIATGGGSTQFQRIGIGQLAGSIPTSVPDLTLVTDGAGGFKTKSSIYARFRTFVTGSVANPVFTTSLVTGGNGFTVDGTAFIFSEAGAYWYSVEVPTYNPPTDGSPTASVTWPYIVNEAAPSVPVTDTLTGIMTFAAGTRYRLNANGYLSLWKIA